MKRLLATAFALAAAAGINTASGALQQRAAVLTRRFRRRGWYVHLALVVPPWAAFLLLLRGLGRQVCWPLPPCVRPFGAPVLAAAGALWVAAFAQLGGATTGNGDLFGHGKRTRVTGGIFRVRRNPMYDSYVLALVGLALRRANAAYLLLAGEAIVLLHGVEARVEGRSLQDSEHGLRAPSET